MSNAVGLLFQKLEILEKCFSWATISKNGIPVMLYVSISHRLSKSKMELIIIK